MIFLLIKLPLYWNLGGLNFPAWGRGSDGCEMPQGRARGSQRSSLCVLFTMSQGMVSCRPDVDFGVDFLSGAGDLKLKHKIVSRHGWRLGDSNEMVHNNKKRKKRAFGPPGFI